MKRINVLRLKYFWIKWSDTTLAASSLEIECSLKMTDILWKLRSFTFFCNKSKKKRKHWNTIRHKYCWKYRLTALFSFWKTFVGALYTYEFTGFFLIIDRYKFSYRHQDLLEKLLQVGNAIVVVICWIMLDNDDICTWKRRTYVSNYTLCGSAVKKYSKLDN